MQGERNERTPAENAIRIGTSLPETIHPPLGYLREALTLITSSSWRISASREIISS